MTTLRVAEWERAWNIAEVREHPEVQYPSSVRNRTKLQEQPAAVFQTGVPRTAIHHLAVVFGEHHPSRATQT